MRIIAGKYKGRVLSSFKGKDIRPTSDKAREALFSILQDKIGDAIVLDLFAGTGAVGIEALSRGANKAVFCDNSKESIALINKNCQTVNCENQAEIYFTPALFMLNRLISAKRKFDVIFLDPPYNTKYGEEALDIIAKNKLLKEGGVIILEKPSTDKVDYGVDGLIMYDKRKYGLNAFKFYKYEEEKWKNVFLQEVLTQLLLGILT